MPALHQSLLDTRALSAKQIHALFLFADRLRDRYQRVGHFFDPLRPPTVGRFQVALLFFEPSTRTRLSFQAAAHRLGAQVLTMESSSSSVVKGETLEDTVLNVVAMGPNALVLRYGQSPELDRLLPALEVPVINAGSGALAHPTQALLDAYTIEKELGSVSGQRVLIVGDVLHSRVARSNFDVLHKLGAEVAVCGPGEWIPDPLPQAEIKVFRNLNDGLAWATVCMGLRIQFERHSNAKQVSDYTDHYGISSSRLQSFSSKGILMHPGPINQGVEFSPEVLQDHRSRVLQQVTNGVLIRAALLSLMLGMEKIDEGISGS